jgi:hypothetical protein
MRPHEQRVVEEKQQLDNRLEALGLFITTSPLFGQLPEAERMRLTAQRRLMQGYSDILGHRIDAFPPTTVQETAAP